MRPVLALTILLVLTTSVLAHDGVRNPAVLARMNGMTSIADNVKALGEMAKGARTFDAAAAQDAAASIARHADVMPKLFETREEDPRSEALPAIWKDFEDFTAKALELEAIARDLESTIATADDLRPALQRLGANCKSCHAVYRE
jgi:cytochrome c556